MLPVPEWSYYSFIIVDRDWGFTLMKTNISVLIATIATSITLTYLRSEPTLAQSNQRFYCGSTNQQEPATILVTQGQEEEKTFIVWKAGDNPRKSCKNVSKAFQRALEQGNSKFIPGKDRGKIWVCGVNPRGKSCTNPLIEVGSQNQAENFARKLESIKNGQGKPPLER
jgi:hypothetical protein